MWRKVGNITPAEQILLQPAEGVLYNEADLFSRELCVKKNETSPAPDRAGNGLRVLVRVALLALFLASGVFLATHSLNLLVIGIDDIDPAEPVDSLWLIGFRPFSRTVASRMVPVETLSGPGPAHQTLRRLRAEMHALGGGSREIDRELRRAVGRAAGCRVHHSLEIRYSALFRWVELIHGVPLNNQEALLEDNPEDGVFLDLPPGPAVLRGSQALHFLRLRRSEESGSRRLERQGIFWQAWWEKSLRPAPLAALAKARWQGTLRFETDLSFPAFLAWVKEFWRVPERDWAPWPLPGRWVYADNQWEFDPSDRRPEAAAAPLSGPTPALTPTPNPTPPSPISAPNPESAETAPSQPLSGANSGTEAPVIRILNGCGQPNLGKRLAARLKQAGLNVSENQIENADSFRYSRSVIHVSTQNLRLGLRIATILQLDSRRVQKETDPRLQHCVTVIVGREEARKLK